ncbi:hypothetical protein OOU_Y34scaffold00533g38 [Pyricularia oryzae Y34]|uniref:Uncharacterized protein n=3 Tax=Pyricularia oryzae TaxID=318829 RepID=A0A4P7N0E0_PYROR|nr:hypothetical protein OOU_Y34scaffold00533g38 [Pyricularia oryzae Y34]QBZ53976.1 hypothetical protein PoMZ_09666 [Pyricularia oryzae]
MALKKFVFCHWLFFLGTNPGGNIARDGGQSDANSGRIA